MNIEQWRTGIRNWLQAKLLIGSWEVRNPTVYNTINAFIPPLESLLYSEGEPGFATATQDIHLVARLRGDILYADLPLGHYQQLHLTIQRRLVTEYKSIANLSELTTDALADGLTVSEYGDGLDADWLITMSFRLNLTWIPERTLLPGDSTDELPTISRILAGLYTSRLEDFDIRDKVGDVEVSSWQE